MLVETFVEAEDGVEVRVTIEVKGGDRTDVRSMGEEKPIATYGVTEQEILTHAQACASTVLALHQDQGRSAKHSGYQTEGDIRTEHTGFDRVYAEAVKPVRYESGI